MSEEWREIRQYFHTLSQAFGKEFLILLFIINFALKGFLYVIGTQAMMPLFKLSGVSASSLQILSALSISPWTMKPLFGILSDFFPLFGYNKRYWMVGGSLFGIFGSIMLVIQIRSMAIMVIFFFFIHMEMAIVDLLSEGKYAELMGKHPESGSSIISFISASQSLGAIVALCLVGPFEDAQIFQPLFLFGLIAAMSPVFFILSGWLPEEKRHSTETGMRGNSWIMVDWKGLCDKYPFVSVILFTGICGPIISSLTTYVSEPVGLASCGVALILCMSGGFYVFPLVIAKVALFQLLLSVGQISVGSALDYFYIADSTCLPGGPAFSLKYYMTFSGIVGSIVAFIGNFAYMAWFSQWKFRTVIGLSIFLRGFAAIFDLVIILRWNIKLGIPDRYFYIFGEAIVEVLVSLLIWIPSSTIIGKVCPRGLEAAVYAYIAGISNLGGIVSQLAGAVIFDRSGLKTTIPCDWRALPWLLVVGHVIIPTVVGIPALFLLPNIGQVESVDQKTEEIALVAEEEY